MENNQNQSNLVSFSVTNELPRKSMSSKLYSLRWDDHFPLRFERKNCVAEYASPDEAIGFLQEKYSEIHQLDQRTGPSFFNEDFTPAKRRYYEEEGDFFLVKESGVPKGVIVGTPLDWSSYNLRTSSFLPELQGSGIHTKLISHVIRILGKNQVLRVEADANPSNFATLQILLRSRFMITGLTLSERWGSMVHLTKYLNENPESKFVKHFCVSSFPKKESRRDHRSF